MLCIVGTGQLGLMLSEAAAKLDASCQVVATPSEIPPSAQCITVESEFIDVDLIRTHLPAGASFAPGQKALGTLQDKLAQKRLFERLGIPTPTYREIEGPEQVTPPCVIKWAKQGYDGRGVLLLRTLEHSEKLDDFFTRARDRKSALYQEDLVPYDREVATVATRAKDGRLVHFPPVETVQRGGVCHEVRTLSDARVDLTTAQQAMTALGNACDLLGTFAIEWFEKDGQLLANECAPRVHNSGHVTLVSTQVSQFDTHVQACLGLTLATPVLLHPHSAMINLIATRSGRAQPPAVPNTPGFSAKWYGKEDLRPGRKMGHINMVAPSEQELEAQIALAREIAARWATG